MNGVALKRLEHFECVNRFLFSSSTLFLRWPRVDLITVKTKMTKRYFGGLSACASIYVSESVEKRNERNEIISQIIACSRALWLFLSPHLSTSLHISVNYVFTNFSLQRADQLSCHWNCSIVSALFAPLSMHFIIVTVNCSIWNSILRLRLLNRINGTKITTKIRSAFLPCTNELIKIAFVVVVAFVSFDVTSWVGIWQLIMSNVCNCRKPTSAKFQARMKNTIDKWIWRRATKIYAADRVRISCPNNLDACRHTFSYIRSDLLSRCRRTVRMLDKQCHM